MHYLATVSALIDDPERREREKKERQRLAQEYARLQDEANRAAKKAPPPIPQQLRPAEPIKAPTPFEQVVPAIAPQPPPAQAALRAGQLELKMRQPSLIEQIVKNSTRQALDLIADYDKIDSKHEENRRKFLSDELNWRLGLRLWRAYFGKEETKDDMAKKAVEQVLDSYGVKLRDLRRAVGGPYEELP